MRQKKSGLCLCIVDSFLDLSDGTLQKCNAAYSYGGAEQAINMLNMNLDLDIQDFVTVDFTAVSDVVDLLGGIEIEIQEEEVQYINELLMRQVQLQARLRTISRRPDYRHWMEFRLQLMRVSDLRREVISQEQSDKEE